MSSVEAVAKVVLRKALTDITLPYVEQLVELNEMGLQSVLTLEEQKAFREVLLALHKFHLLFKKENAEVADEVLDIFGKR